MILIQMLKSFYFAYERYFSAGALLFGFVVDNLTLDRIDLLFENLILFSYILIAGLGIVGVQFLKSGHIHFLWFGKVAPFFPLFIQFAFGGLFSAFFVFYSRSGELAGSWLFILIVLAFLIGNEFFRRRYQELAFQISIFYLALFSYTIFSIPVLVGAMSAYIFLISGSASLILVSALLYVLIRISPAHVV